MFIFDGLVRSIHLPRRHGDTEKFVLILKAFFSVPSVALW
jgi:hypothetical protein